MNRSPSSFQRVCKLLDYIHTHMDSPLSLDELAQQSCWSRWQLQRVFQGETGLSVAHYVRELKLSRAAELLLADSARVIDIAISLGFSSEISFSRSFKQYFGISPRAYRKQGQIFGLRQPLQPSFQTSIDDLPSQLIEVKVESCDAFRCYGVSGKIRGLLSPEPDFSDRVPKLWNQFNNDFQPIHTSPLMGVIDVTAAYDDGSNLRYLAGTTSRVTSQGTHVAESIQVPAQTYAVVKHRGPVAGLAKTLEWFIFQWLPQSEYRGVDGFELEQYPEGYQCELADAEMEYWLPITPAKVA